MVGRIADVGWLLFGRVAGVARVVDLMGLVELVNEGGEKVRGKLRREKMVAGGNLGPGQDVGEEPQKGDRKEPQTS